MERVSDTVIQIGATVAAIVTAAAGFTNWAYETFQTKEQGDQRVVSIERRLERIEDKIDRISEITSARKRN